MGVLERVRDLENGRSVQFLTDSAYRIFGSPVYVIDAFYNLIAFSGVLAEEPFWNELIRTGTFPADAMELMADEQIVKDVAYSDKVVRLKSDKLTGDLISGHIYNGDNIWVGETTMSEKTPFDAEGIAAFEELLNKISSEISDNDYFTKQPAIFFENTINKLLDRDIENTPVNNPQAQIIHYGLNKYLYVAVVTAVRNNILESVHKNRLTYFQSLLKTVYKSCRYAVYSDHIVMLMSSEYGEYDKALPLGLDHSIFEHNDLHAGVSGSFENIFELRKYYDQAAAALKNGLAANDSRRVFIYNDAE